MDLLKKVLPGIPPPNLPGRMLAAGTVCLLLIFSLIPVADTLWAEVLTVSGDVETGSFEQTATETFTPSPTASPTLTPTWTAQAGTSLQAYKTAQTRWKEDATGKVFIVFGRICVMNGGEVPTLGLTLFDQVEIKPRRSTWQPLPGANLLIVPNEPLQPGEVACFEYEIEVVYFTDTVYRNSVQVTILNHSGWLPGGQNCPGAQPCPFGPQTRADFKPPSLDAKPTASPSPTSGATLPAGNLPAPPRTLPTTTPSLTATPPTIAPSHTPTAAFSATSTATLIPTVTAPTQPGSTPSFTPPSPTPTFTDTPAPSPTPVPTSTPLPPTATNPPPPPPPPPTEPPQPTPTYAMPTNGPPINDP